VFIDIALGWSENNTSLLTAKGGHLILVQDEEYMKFMMKKSMDQYKNGILTLTQLRTSGYVWRFRQRRKINREMASLSILEQ
jgi:hypothetical protein